MISATFLSLVGAISRPGTFTPYAVVGVLALLFFVAKVPETKGRSLEEIAGDLGAAERHDHPDDRRPARSAG